MAKTREIEATLLTLLVGAAFGAGIALLLKKEVRGKVLYVTGDAVGKLEKILCEKSPGFNATKSEEVPPTFI